MLFGWFGTVIGESEGGLYNLQGRRVVPLGDELVHLLRGRCSSRVFFGTLFYARVLVVPWLAGEGDNFFTNFMLWPGFENTLAVDGSRRRGRRAHGRVGHCPPRTRRFCCSRASRSRSRTTRCARVTARRSIVWLAATFLLGFLFLGFQAEEYIHAYTELNLRLDTGIYGGTFFMLTGFHGLHVTLGAVMLLIIWLRVLRGHFKPDRHFAFEAVAWYWHFVDVVWLGLFFFVYWI